MNNTSWNLPYRFLPAVMTILRQPQESSCNEAVLSDDRIAIIDTMQASDNHSFTITDKKAIVFVASTIKPPLVIETTLQKYLPLLISAIPIDALHIFKSIKLHQINPETLDQSSSHIPFSRFLKESIFKKIPDTQKLFLINRLECANDTTIASCGNIFQHVEQVYIHTWAKPALEDQRPPSSEGSVILIIKNQDTQRRYFKGIWNSTSKNIAFWDELMPEIAELEISRLKSIA